MTAGAPAKRTLSLPGYEGAEWGAPKTLAEKTAADLAGEKRAAVVNLAATTAARETVGKIQDAAFIAAFGSGAEITIEPGQMAVVAKLNYDNSDSMTDYFDRHCGIGPGFVLAVGKSGRETEARARAAVALYPELAGVQFAWKTEKWSMGHGNYLEAESGFVKLTPEMAGNRSIYRGGEVPAARWEITFRKAHSAAETLPAFKGYPNGQPSAPSVPSASGEAALAIAGVNRGENDQLIMAGPNLGK